MEYYVYILSNKINTAIYTGVTRDLIRRVYEHKNHLDKGSFTAQYNVDKLVYYETTSNVDTAIEREKIWWNHLQTDKVHIPLATDIDIKLISEKYEFCGREIKNAVKKACVSAALRGDKQVFQKDLIKACEDILIEKKNVDNASDETDSSRTRGILKDVLQIEIDKNKKEEK